MLVTDLAECAWDKPHRVLRYTVHTVVQQCCSYGRVQLRGSLRERTDLVFSQPCLLGREGNILNKFHLINVVLYKSQRASLGNTGYLSASLG